MRFFIAALSGLFITLLFIGCVDPFDRLTDGTANILVVDGTITNLSEPQLIRLSRSKADPLTGRSLIFPITKAIVDVVVDGAQMVAYHETTDGTYQLPSDFKGQVGHSYSLRFTLSDGTQYESTQQVMQPVPTIDRVTARFNPKSVSPALDGYYTAGHELFVDWKDPANQTNYYRWEWRLWEKQAWCRSCQQGVYAVNLIPQHAYKDKTFYVSTDQPNEDCFIPINYLEAGQPPFRTEQYTYDYPCRSECWEILYSSSLNVFADQFINGNTIQGRNVGQVPYYDSTACLVEIRQLSLPTSAYAYFKRFQDQTQNAGGLADSPPSAPVGNVQNVADAQERVVGYFTASAVSSVRYWLDRKDATGLPFGNTDPYQVRWLPGNALFYALNRREPNPEPIYPYPNVRVFGGPPRPVTALCIPSDSRTPTKPEGWRD